MLEERSPVYNFEVENWNSYFVGEVGVLVHNYPPKVDKTYKRPSGYRKGVRDEVWDKAKNSEGNVTDPVSGKTIDSDEPWDMGHKPGYEFRKHKESAKERDISRKQFLDEHNDPDHYRPELPGSNRSHKGEDVTDIYYGP